MAFVNVTQQFNGAPTKTQIIYDTASGVKKKTTEMAKYTHQSLSGEKYQDFSDLSKDGVLKNAIEWYTKQSQTGSRIQESNKLGIKLQALEDKLEELEQEIRTAQSEFTTAQSAVGPTMGLDQLTKSHLEKIKSILNTRVDGIAIFGGYDFNDDPITDIVNNSNIVNGKPTSNYSVSSQEEINYQVTNSSKVNFNLVASDESFVKIIGSFHLALEGKVSDAAKMLEDGRKLLQQKMTNVSNNARIIENRINDLKDEEKAINEVHQKLFAADKAEAATLSKQIEDSIKVSYWAMSRIFSLDFTSYLRDI